MEQLRQQCPDTDNHVLRLAAMGTSRFKRLQKRLEEQRLKREQEERMKDLETQVSQLNECNMQWMHYYQQQQQAQQAQWQQQAWEAAAAWQYGQAQPASASQAAREGLRLFFQCMACLFYFVLASCNAKSVSHLRCHLFFFVLLAGQGDGRTRKHEEGSSSTAEAARGLFFVVTAVLVCCDCFFQYHHLDF